MPYKRIGTTVYKKLPNGKLKSVGVSDSVEAVAKAIAGDPQAAQKLADKVKRGDAFDLNDFLAQIQQMRSMGGLSNIMDLI